jgi:prepilin-type processing-associated H-X9-DG protein
LNENKDIGINDSEKAVYMKRYTKSFLTSIIVISIPSVFVLMSGLVGILIFGGISSLLWWVYDGLRKDANKSFTFSFVLTNVVWWLMLCLLVENIVFIYKFDGIGIVGKFAVLIELFFFLPFTFTIILGFKAIGNRLGRVFANTIMVISLLIFLWFGCSGKFSIFQASGKAKKAACLSNLKMLSLAMYMYADDNDGYLPPEKANWTKLQYPYTKSKFILSCPVQPARENESSYGLNSNLENIKIEELVNSNKIIMLFESEIGKNPRGRKELLATPTRHLGGYNIGFADGHTKFYLTESITDKMWGRKIK